MRIWNQIKPFFIETTYGEIISCGGGGGGGGGGGSSSSSSYLAGVPRPDGMRKAGVDVANSTGVPVVPISRALVPEKRPISRS